VLCTFLASAVVLVSVVALVAESDCQSDAAALLSLLFLHHRKEIVPTGSSAVSKQLVLVYGFSRF
jgi:hypothetical protein